MTSEVHDSDASKAKSADPLVSKGIPKARFEYMPSPFFPQARMIYPSETTLPETTIEPVAPKPVE